MDFKRKKTLLNRLLSIIDSDKKIKKIELSKRVEERQQLRRQEKLMTLERSNLISSINKGSEKGAQLDIEGMKRNSLLVRDVDIRIEKLQERIATLESNIIQVRDGITKLHKKKIKYEEYLDEITKENEVMESKQFENEVEDLSRIRRYG